MNNFISPKKDNFETREDLPQEYYKKRFEEMVEENKKLLKAYNEKRDLALKFKKEVEFHNETIQIQKLYINKLEKENEKLKKQKLVDPDAMLSVR